MARNALRGARYRGLPVVLVCLLVPAICVAHVENFLNSVHFNGAQTDFSVLPRRGLGPSHLNDRATFPPGIEGQSRDAYAEVSQTRDDWAVYLRDRRISAAALRIVSLCRGRRYYAALAECKAVWKRFGPGGNLRDRIEVLERIASTRSAPTALHDTTIYLRALDLYNAPDFDAATTLFKKTARSKDRYLAAHSSYQLASLSFSDGDLNTAANLYRAFLRNYPSSDKVEPALIMAARCNLLRFTESSDGKMITRLTPTQTRDGAWALAELVRRFPHSRFRNSIPGLRARVALARGDIGTALGIYFGVDDVGSVRFILAGLAGPAVGRIRIHLFESYLMRLQRLKQFAGWSDALNNLSHLRRVITGRDARQFITDMLANPQLAAPYFQYRLDYTSPTPGDLANLVRLARRITTAHPTLALPALVCMRVAEVYQQAGKYRQAIKWSVRAERTRPLAAAIYVRAAALHKLHKLQPAVADFRSILARFPTSPLRHAAREEIALLCESTGDLPGALNQYFELGYLPDIAYLLDVRIPVSTLQVLATASGLDARYHVAAFPYTDEAEAPSSRRTDSRRELIKYSLAMRYMRVDRLSDARNLLQTISARALTQYRYLNSHVITYLDKNVPNPEVTVNRLLKLNSAIREADTRAAKARAAYRLATYLYNRGGLVYYNAPVWMSGREFCFDFNWNKNEASKADTAAVERYMFQHETYVHVERLCLGIAAKYPHSPEAPKALWRAACCEFRLSNFNEWWRTEDYNHAMVRRAAHYMNEIGRRYPHNSLAHEGHKYAYVFLIEG